MQHPCDHALHVTWEFPEHAAARFDALANIPVADRPNAFEDWDQPPPAAVRLLWTQLYLFYADGEPTDDHRRLQTSFNRPIARLRLAVFESV